MLATLGLAAFAAHPASAQTTITNGSFQANSFAYFPGYVNTGGNGTISGWISNNNFSGLNPYGANGDPFANNGIDPNGGNVAFLETGSPIGASGTSVSTTTLTQTLTNLKVGDQYQISFYDNSRQNGAAVTQNPTLSLLLGGTSLYSASIAPVTGANSYNFVTSSTYTAIGTSADLMFSSASSKGQDATALIDGVSIRDIGPASAAPEPSQIGMLALAVFGLGALVVKARKRTTAAQTA